MDEPKLTRESQEAIRHYLLKLFMIPGTAGAVVVFFLGYFIRDVAVRKAEYDAFNRVSDTVVKLAEDAQKSRIQLDEISQDVTKFDEEQNRQHEMLRTTVARFEADRKTIEKQFQPLKETIDRSMKQLDGLLKNPKQVLDVLEALEKHPKAEEIAASQNELEQRIEAHEKLLQNQFRIEVGELFFREQDFQGGKDLNSVHRKFTFRDRFVDPPSVVVSLAGFNVSRPNHVFATVTDVSEMGFDFELQAPIDLDFDEDRKVSIAWIALGK